MNGLMSARGAASAALRFSLVAAMLMLAAEMSQAAPGRDRGSGRDGRTHGRVVDRSYNGRGARTYARGGDPGYSGERRPTHRGGGRAYDGGSRAYVGGGPSYPDRAVRIYDGGGRTYGGVRYYQGGGSYDGPYGYRVIQRPAFVSLGIGLGTPYYRPPVYRYGVEPGRVEVGSGASIDVTNEPPAGCYYYDRSCDRQFSNLDEYTDHIESQDHARTIVVVRRDSGETLWTLEFVGGIWSVEK